MKRQVDLKDISDGKLYKSKDMVKADCLGCKGCSACCKGMGESIVLDPYDVYQLFPGGLQEGLNAGYVELHVVDGVILPNIAMKGKGDSCLFLNDQGRCSCYEKRPGICRLFPLGRVYENDTFYYILQTGECEKPHAKVKVEKWLQIPNLPQYEAFIQDWHKLLMDLQDCFANKGEEVQKKLDTVLLQLFFMTPFEAEDFYGQMQNRLEYFREEFLNRER